jgi:hypothetical protein
MPNWCSNKFVISHADPAMLQRGYDALLQEKFLSEFLPIPEDLHIVAGSVADPVEQIALEAAEQRNRKLYGHKNWYDWCVTNWGTKWDFGDKYALLSENRSYLAAAFDTAWAPPCEAYTKLQDMGFKIKAYYFEPGMMFCGVWDNGSYDHFDISGSPSEIASQIPRDLDIEMRISESFAEWAESDAEWSED